MNKYLKRVTGFKLFLPLFCLFLILLVNVVKDSGILNADVEVSFSRAFDFFKVSVNNGVLYGRLVDILNRGSEIAILAIGMTLVVAVSAGTDISVGSVMALSAAVTCRTLTGGAQAINSVQEMVVPIAVGLIAGVLIGGVCGTFNGFMVSKLKIQPMVATLILFTAARSIEIGRAHV